jgi:hypothetical protein
MLVASCIRLLASASLRTSPSKVALKVLLTENLGMLQLLPNLAMQHHSAPTIRRFSSSFGNICCLLQELHNRYLTVLNNSALLSRYRAYR